MRKMMAGVAATAAAAALGTAGMQGVALAQDAPGGSTGSDAGSAAGLQLMDLIQKYTVKKDPSTASNTSTPGAAY